MLLAKKHHGYFIILLIIILLCLSFISLLAGQFKIPPGEVIHTLFNLNDSTNQEAHAILYYLRLPRTVVALMVGMALGMAGAVMQGIFSNPLADPGIIGVSAGAALGAVIAISLGIDLAIFTLPTFAFVGAMVAIVIALLLSMQQGKIPVMILLLAGIAVSMFMGAITSGILTFISQQQLQQYLFWMVGGLDYRRWEHVEMAIIPITFGLSTMMILARHLNILVLGETEAKAVGMNVLLYRLIFLALAALTTAAAVCIAGPIGFVGLITPHMMRIICGPDHRYLLPISALAGGIFLLFCDILGRIIMPPTEIRVGIISALIGAPYFLYLLRKMRQSSLY